MEEIEDYFFFTHFKLCPNGTAHKVIPREINWKINPCYFPCGNVAQSLYPESIFTFSYDVPEYNPTLHISYEDDLFVRSMAVHSSALDYHSNSNSSLRSMKGLVGSCNYQSMEGTWEKGSIWIAPFACSNISIYMPDEITKSFHRTDNDRFQLQMIQSPLYNDSHLQFRHTPDMIHGTQRTYFRSNNTGTVCLLGDSNARPLALDLPFNVYLHRYLHRDLDFHALLTAGPPVHLRLSANFSVIEGFQYCLESIFELSNHYQQRGVLIWGVGSHGTKHSIQQNRLILQNGLTNLLEMVGNYTNRREHYHLHGTKGIVKDPCIIVTGSLDIEFEGIPVKLHSHLKYFQNSWRLLSQNQAIRAEVESFQKQYKHLHFVDIHSASLSLHFDGHKNDDPVHFSEVFYQFIVNLLLRTIEVKCSR
jgi:hypothetical protein